MSSSTIEQRSLHGKVREQLRAQYVGSDGGALPSLRELSRQLGVNHATVSRALRDLEKEGVVEIVPRKGIFSISVPARKNSGASLTGKATSAGAIELALFASEHQSVLDIATSLMKGIERVTGEKTETATGMPGKLSVIRSILNVPPLPDAEAYVAGLRARGVGGVAFLGFGYLNFPETHHESTFLFEVSRRMPTVLIGGPHPNLKLDCVFSDPRPHLNAFLEECYADGLRDFEYLGMRTHLPHQRLRHEEFCRFIMRHGLTWPGNHYDDLSTPDLAVQLKSLKKLPEVVVAVNINRALTFILEAQRRGLKLPDEIRVFCFASSPGQAAPIMPYATVAMLDEAAVGERAIRLLLERWNQPPVHSHSTQWQTVPAHVLKP